MNIVITGKSSLEVKRNAVQNRQEVPLAQQIFSPRARNFGRCLRFVEAYLQSLQRVYANTHTEDDITGRSNLAMDSDLNNYGGTFGFAYRLPKKWA